MPPQMTPVVKNLLLINVIFFLATVLLESSDGINITNLLALHYPTSEYFQPFQLVTHFFMHGGIGHIFFNVFALIMFGSTLETLWGPKRFLFFYLFSAFGAAALHLGYDYVVISGLMEGISAFVTSPSPETYWGFFNQVPLESFKKAGGVLGQYATAVDQLSLQMNTNEPQAVREAVRLMSEYVDSKSNTPVVGASGAIFGLLLAFGMYFPNAELMLIFLPIPIKAKFFIPVLMMIELFLGINQFSWDNTAHFAHLGGAISGFFLILYWRKFGSRW